MSLQFDSSTLLGTGGFGRTFPGEFEGRQVAVKKIEQDQLNHQFLDRDRKKEEEALLELDHPNIVKLFHIQRHENFE